MGPVRGRIAAVLAGGRQGSGYLLSDRAVLTAAHVVTDGGDVRVALPGRPALVPARVLWSRLDQDCDAALLLADGKLVNEKPGPVEWSGITSLDPIPDCQAIGFPYAQRDSDGHLESEQFIGTVKPGSSLIGGRLVVDSVHTAPAARSDGRSPWAGFSGAALFRGDLLLGVVRSDPGRWQHGRIEATGVDRIFGMPAFQDALRQAGAEIAPATRISPGRPDADADIAFERRYAGYLDRKHGTLTIFGLDLHDRSAANWPLDTAYLSLEASAPVVADPRAGTYPHSSMPAEQALAGQRRVLLRGVAGSGKTTLVQWLAVSAARQRLPEELGHLRGKVPFVLPLRTLIRRGELPVSPADFLPAVNSSMAGEQPAGWARRVLADGRGLMMVDGLDEVSERERERVRGWLRELLIVYPGNLWLVTSRPSAVDDAWLAGEGFTELTLSPMSRDDIASFVKRWHDTASRTCQDAEEEARLASYAQSLLVAIRTKQDLGRLATNPLMCGMICALHRDRRGYLPHGRKELYDAALAMLTADRDQRRDIGAPDGVELTAEPQIQLLQRLAYWLIRNGRSELDRDHAERIIAEALPSVPAAAAQGDARVIFRHLLLRSGVLRQPTAGTVDFIHRTFQDYLGAKRAVEEWDIGLLVDKASDAQWEDVIRMAVAHARPRERAEILQALINRPGEDEAALTRVALLAMACLEHATELDPAVRQSVQDLASQFIPPRNIPEARALAEVGSLVLELLPGPEGCPDEDASVATVVTASLIGTDAAIPVLRRFRGHPSHEVHAQLAVSWGRFDDARYFEEVIAHLPQDNLTYAAESETHLRLLRDPGGRPRMDLLGDFSAQQIAEYLDPQQLTKLGLWENSTLTDLGVLRAFSRLRQLALWRCPSLRDLSAVRDLPLKALIFTPCANVQPPALLTVLPPTLKALELKDMDRLAALPTSRAPHVQFLILNGVPTTRFNLGWVADTFPALLDLYLRYTPNTPPVDISPLAGLPALRYLELVNATATRRSRLRAKGVEIAEGPPQPE